MKALILFIVLSRCFALDAKAVKNLQTNDPFGTTTTTPRTIDPYGTTTTTPENASDVEIYFHSYSNTNCVNAEYKGDISGMRNYDYAWESSV